MKRTLGMLGMTVGGWVGWWLGSFVGIGTAALLSGIAGGVGLFAVRWLGERYLE